MVAPAQYRISLQFEVFDLEGNDVRNQSLHLCDYWLIWNSVPKPFGYKDEETILLVELLVVSSPLI